jgi:hypothetical protein
LFFGVVRGINLLIIARSILYVGVTAVAWRSTVEGFRRVKRHELTLSTVAQLVAHAGSGRRTQCDYNERFVHY